MNNKTAPNQMRILLKRMRDNNYVVDESQENLKKDLSMRDMLKITRTLNEQEDDEKKLLNKKTVYDQSWEEEKFRNFFNDINVSIKFIDLEVYDNLIFWGGTDRKSVV